MIEWNGKEDAISSGLQYLVGLLPEIQEGTPCGLCTVNSDF